MRDFRGWLLLDEGRQELVPPGVLQGYEHEFKKALAGLIERTEDPVLKDKFKTMLDCPIRSPRTGRCYTFSEYILSALIRNGVHHRFDIEAALAYVFEQLMSHKSLTTGQPRDTVFGRFDEKRPYHGDFNPLQARFLAWLEYAVRNIRKGKIPRLATVERRPQGTVSIGIGRQSKEDQSGDVSPDEIVARRSNDDEYQEIVTDIITLLRQKEAAYPIPLVALFRAIISGQRTEEQARRFGDRPSRVGRQVIIQTIQQYAQSTGNHHLLQMLERFKDFRSNQPMPPKRKPTKTVKPKLEPGKDKDFTSIVSVIDKLGGRPVGSADLGRYRRRWLEYPPRDAASGFKNRLEEVLSNMVREGVLRASRTTKGATLYLPGPEFEKYQAMLRSVS